MYPHRIHLHGPWDCEPLTRTAQHADGRIEPVAGPVPKPLRMRIPCRWKEGGLGPFAGRVRFQRRFHWPGRLDYYERLWLVFWGADYLARVWLNGEELGAHEGAFDPFEFEVTRLIRPRNELLVEVGSLSGENGGLWGEVALEVRREAFLRNVRLWATFEKNTPKLHVAGEVFGEAGGQRELYVLLDDATVLYQPLPGVGPFDVSIETPSAERWWPAALSRFGRPRVYEVRVELVEGASKLDSQTFPFGFREVHAETESEPLRINGVELPADRPPVTIDLALPVMHVNLDEVNRQGTPIRLRRPCPPGGRETEEWIRQRRAITERLQANPAIVGWK